MKIARQTLTLLLAAVLWMGVVSVNAAKHNRQPADDSPDATSASVGALSSRSL